MDDMIITSRNVVFKKKHPEADIEHIGLVTMMLDPEDTRSAAKQLNDGYNHGGGWRPFNGFKMLDNGNLKYPGDPQTQLLWEAKLRDETIRVYEHAWFAVVQPDGSFEVCRMD